MDKVAIVARLKAGAKARAAELLAQGAPFDTDESGLERHVVYLSAGEVVFVFEGPEVESIVDSLISEPFHWPLLHAFDAWRSLVDGNPRIARPAFEWEHGRVRESAG
jgi:hypothetical protein